MNRIKTTNSSMKRENKIVSDALLYFSVDDYFSEETNQIRKKIQTDVGPVVKRTINEYIEKAQFPELCYSAAIATKVAIGYMKAPYGTGKNLKNLFASILELGRLDASVGTAYLVNFILFANSIDDYGSEEQRAYFLPKLLDGKIIGSWGLTEPNFGSDASSLESNCEQLPDGKWKIDGHKRWVGNGDKDFMIVFAREIKSKQVKAFIVDLTLPGIQRHAIKYKMSLRGVQNVDIKFTNVIVEAGMQLPKVQSFENVNEMLAHSRIGVAMIACGVGVGIYENTIKYLNNRTQFNKKLVSFQLVQEKLVRMMGNIQACLLMVCKGIDLINQKKISIGKLGLIKSWVTLRIRETAALGRELLGGNGIVAENHVMTAFCDIEGIYTYEGTYDINALVSGRELTGISAFK